MAGLFNQNEKTNTILFAVIWMVFILTIEGVTVSAWLPYIEPLFLVLLLFGSIIYGFISRNPKKSLLLGILIWASMPLHLLTSEAITRQLFASGNFAMIDFVTLIIFLLIVGVINGGAAYLIATDHTDSKKELIYHILALILSFISIILFFAISWKYIALPQLQNEKTNNNFMSISSSFFYELCDNNCNSHNNYWY